MHVTYFWRWLAVWQNSEIRGHHQIQRGKVLLDIRISVQRVCGMKTTIEVRENIKLTTNIITLVPHDVSLPRCRKISTQRHANNLRQESHMNIQTFKYAEKVAFYTVIVSDDFPTCKRSLYLSRDKNLLCYSLSPSLSSAPDTLTYTCR